ncbi:MAG: winged helix-turn-helix transcriptional regulator [Desulfocapsa sp.]|nr:winged helix-turn-helix transcriptional regulator [Desulfocapsa sp.]
MRIWNSGRLPDEWDITTLLGKHSSEPYNPDIANGFFRAGMIESWGRGIEHIFKSCLNSGTTQPEFSYEHTGLWVRFSFTAPDVGEKESTQETTQERIILLLKANPVMSRKGLADQIGITADGIKYHLKKLSDNGVIKHRGSTKSGYWEVLTK